MQRAGGRGADKHTERDTETDRQANRQTNTQTDKEELSGQNQMYLKPHVWSET